MSVRTSVAWPWLQEPWLPCFPVILVRAGFRGGLPQGVTSRQPQVSSPPRHQHHRGRQPQDQPSRRCAASLRPGHLDAVSWPLPRHRRPAPSPGAHTFQSPEPAGAPGARAASLCRKAGNNSQRAGSPLKRRASTAPVSAAELGVHTMAPWGGGLGCDPRSRGACACKVTKPGLGDPALGPGVDALWDPPGCGRVALRFVSQAFCLLLLGRLSFSSGLRRAVSVSALRSQEDLGGAQQLQGVWTREVRRKRAFLCPALKAGVTGLLPAPAHGCGRQILGLCRRAEKTSPGLAQDRCTADATPPPLNSNRM